MCAYGGVKYENLSLKSPEWNLGDHKVRTNLASRPVQAVDPKITTNNGFI